MTKKYIKAVINSANKDGVNITTYYNEIENQQEHAAALIVLLYDYEQRGGTLTKLLKSYHDYRQCILTEVLV